MTAQTKQGTAKNHRLRSAVLLAAVLISVGGANASAATTAPAAPNPATNIQPGPLPRACAQAPKGPACLAGAVANLDRARAQLGLGPYLLPADFDALSGTQQLLILCNLDRLAYGLPAIDGLVPALNVVASAAVTDDVDPDPSALLRTLSDYSWSSNWAGDYENAPEAYYAWMYYDGWGGKQTSNLDCTSATAPGCWGHREDILSFPAQGALSMGASVSRDAEGQIGYAITLVWTPTPNWPAYSYTWARAQAGGAGSPGAATTAAARRARVAASRHA